MAVALSRVTAAGEIVADHRTDGLEWALAAVVVVAVAAGAIVFADTAVVAATLLPLFVDVAIAVVLGLAPLADAAQRT
jgi:hypothetical protein